MIWNIFKISVWIVEPWKQPVSLDVKKMTQITMNFPNPKLFILEKLPERTKHYQLDTQYDEPSELQETPSSEK